MKLELRISGWLKGLFKEQTVLKRIQRLAYKEGQWKSMWARLHTLSFMWSV